MTKRYLGLTAFEWLVLGGLGLLMLMVFGVGVAVVYFQPPIPPVPTVVIAASPTTEPPPASTATPEPTAKPLPTDTPSPLPPIDTATAPPTATSIPPTPVIIVVTPTPKPPQPSPTATAIPGWVDYISHDAGHTWWRRGTKLPSGCEALINNWACCPGTKEEDPWRLQAGAVVPVGEKPEYRDFFFQAPFIASRWAEEWKELDYKIITNILPAKEHLIGMIVGQDPGAENDCLPFGATFTIYVGTAPPEPTPTATAIPITVGATFQSFPGGYMLWRADTREIYVLLFTGRWSVYSDTWQEGDPHYSCPEAENNPPAGPARGFGKLWCEEPGLMEALGLPSEKEEGYRMEVQERGTTIIVTNPSGLHYELRSDGTYSREVEVTKVPIQ